MSCLKYTSAWSRPLKPAPPETAAATMVQPPCPMVQPPRHKNGASVSCIAGVGLRHPRL